LPFQEPDGCSLYVIMQSIVGPPGSAPAPKAAETSPSSSCLIDVKDGVLQLTLNRPDRFNAFNFDMYSTVQKTLEDANGRDDVRAILITGAGKYYSSGNDLANFMTIPPEGPQKLAADAAKILEAFVNAFIEVQKPLIAAVNGPAIGIPGTVCASLPLPMLTPLISCVCGLVAVTLLGLFDFVYASNTATFHTPFTSLGQSPEVDVCFYFFT
jgi:Delta3-Delta2-enoyl-CoA isomerase